MDRNADPSLSAIAGAREPGPYDNAIPSASGTRPNGPSMRQFGTTALLALAVSACSRSGGDPYLRKHSPELLPTHAGLAVENGVPAEAAARIAAYFQRDSARADLLRIYQVPGLPDRHLVVTHSEADTADYGLRFVLVSSGPGSVTEIARSRGMSDSEWLEPVFFADGDCQFALADTGAETSWGLQAFRLCRDTLQSLGAIDVSLPARDTSTGLAENPLPFARMRRDPGGPVVEFGTDLLVWTADPATGEMRDSMVRMRAGRPLAFRLAGGSFHRVGQDQMLPMAEAIVREAPGGAVPAPLQPTPP